MDQAELDARIQAYYSRDFVEAERLTVRSAQGRLELERVQELIAARIPEGSRILDVGGATGVHAAPLAARGHEVVLIDPVPSQVHEALRHGTFEAAVGDARDLRFEDDSFDVALLFGPLYHLAAREDRLLALGEARRVVRPGGGVFRAGTSTRPRSSRRSSATPAWSTSASALSRGRTVSPSSRCQRSTRSCTRRRSGSCARWGTCPACGR